MKDNNEDGRPVYSDRCHFPIPWTSSGHLFSATTAAVAVSVAHNTPSVCVFLGQRRNGNNKNKNHNIYEPLCPVSLPISLSLPVSVDVQPSGTVHPLEIITKGQATRQRKGRTLWSLFLISGLVVSPVRSRCSALYGTKTHEYIANKIQLLFYGRIKITPPPLHYTPPPARRLCRINYGQEIWAPDKF